jgi:hypothetical protein
VSEPFLSVFSKNFDPLARLFCLFAALFPLLQNPPENEIRRGFASDEFHSQAISI